MAGRHVFICRRIKRTRRIALVGNGRRAERGTRGENDGQIRLGGRSTSHAEPVPESEGLS
jgi:hypothetical protein